uniref:tRNA 2-thiocytidine(32) synthetase TtcA n=1 Tax=uncultured Mycoplasmataceae bacterium TaxID=300027 RepID=A0A6G9HI21_9MOLU|nr:tRNA 2-thiocytidine(32) synthetase TtcA [uncultured Mycoplasmataceae bacterium]
MRELVGEIIKSNKVFNLIEDGDKICVGVSCGKDSSLLLLALNLYKQYVKNKYGWNIKIYGVHIKMNLYKDIDYSKYKKFMKNKKVNFKTVESNMNEILLAKKKKGVIQCSLCAKLKKAILVKEAKKLKCNKIAMAHHVDDAIETLFMNMIHEGRIATFNPKNYFDRTDMTLIRPFCLLREKSLIREAKKQNIPIIKRDCPIDGKTERTYIKSFLEKNFYKNKKFSMSYENFLVALLNGKQSSLWFDESAKKDLLIKYNSKL